MCKQPKESTVILCRSCDLAISKVTLTEHERALCPRCNTALYDIPYCTTNGMLALCISALVFYFPANFLPVLELHFMGSVRTATVFQGALSVFEQGYWLVGLAVLLAAIICPGLLIISILGQILISKFILSQQWAQRIFKLLLTHHKLISQLTMLEIYVLSLLVSIFQLSDFSELYFGMGTFCFSMLFIFTLFLQREYSLEFMWSLLERENPYESAR